MLRKSEFLPTHCIPYTWFVSLITSMAFEERMSNVVHQNKAFGKVQLLPKDYQQHKRSTSG